MGIVICLIASALFMSGVSAWIGYSYAADMLNTERDACIWLTKQNDALQSRLKGAEYEIEKLKNHLSEYELQNSKSGSIKDDVRKIKVVM